MKYSADPTICITPRCRRKRHIYRNGEGRPSYRCQVCIHEMRRARAQFDNAALELRRLGDQSERLTNPAYLWGQ